MKRLEDFLVTGLLSEQDATPYDARAYDAEPGSGGSGGGMTGAAPVSAPTPASAPDYSNMTAKKMRANWNWREHSKEENIAHGRNVANKEDIEFSERKP